MEKTVKMTWTLDFYSDLGGSRASRNLGSHSGSPLNNKNDRIVERVLGSLSLPKTLGPKPLNLNYDNMLPGGCWQLPGACAPHRDT